MPCNSDYMNATRKEVEISRVACLLDELDGKKWSPSSWDGYHPNVYSRSFNADKLVSELCEKLQKLDVTKYSLEMQIWWRDHQKADKERIQKEIEDKKTEDDKKKAISKLTAYERGILGIK